MVGIPLYRVGMLSVGLECFLEGWNAFNRVGVPLYRVGMLSTGLECFRQCWNTFVLSWNAFSSVGMLSTVLEYLCTELEYVSTQLECYVQGRHVSYWVGMLPRGLECFRQSRNAFVQGWNTFGRVGIPL
jgi:hypothetical protein